MDVVKTINEDTLLMLDDDCLLILKRIMPEDVETYRKIKKIDCPNVVRVTGFTEYEDFLWVKREYIKGKSLETYLSEKGILSDKETDRIAIDIISGLKEIHKQGIVHRDLTPGNIIIDDNCKAVIIDFGISRVEKSGKNTDTEILGTKGYAAPEQYGFSQTTARSDIYSLGVLLNYIKTGKMPNEEQAEGKYGKIVEKCTRMDAEMRYPDVAAVEKDILKNQKLTQRIIRKIPGFQTGKVYQEVISSPLYTLYFIFSLMDLASENTPFVKFVSVLTWTCLLLSPMIIFFNSWNWPEKLKIKSKVVLIAIKLLAYLFMLVVSGGLLTEYIN